MKKLEGGRYDVKGPIVAATAEEAIEIVGRGRYPGSVRFEPGGRGRYVALLLETWWDGLFDFTKRHGAKPVVVNSEPPIVP